MFYGEYLLNAQGEDVVAGTRTPLPINKKQKSDPSIQVPRGGDARGVQAAPGDQIDPGAPLQGHAGRRIHHPAQEALDAPDRERQENGLRRVQDRRGHGEGRAHRQGRGPDARKPGRAQPDPSSHLRPEGDRKGPQRREDGGQRPERRTGRRHGQGRLQRGGRRGLGSTGRKGDPRPDRDLPGGYTGHERGPGHSHVPRRHDEPRGACGQADGQGLRRGMRRARHQLQDQDDQDKGQDHQRR